VVVANRSGPGILRPVRPEPTLDPTREARVPELPMFPLGTVLLPHQVLPLHVFEPRYRAMLTRVLAEDGRFGVVLITRGHEVGGGDERTDVGTVAQVLRAESLDDGRALVLAVGTEPLRVRRWLPDDPYPLAVTEIGEPDPDEDERLELRELVDLVTPRVRRVLEMQQELGDPGVPPDVTVDEDPVAAGWQLAVMSPLTPLDAQRLLEARPWPTRLRLLDELVAGLEETLTFRLASGPA
jgi:Lon protease-like protein